MSRRDAVGNMADMVAGRARSGGSLRANVDMGLVATLRRLDPTQLAQDAPAAYRFLADCGVDLGALDTEALGRWVLVAHVIALARGHHDGRIPIGKGLDAIKLSEARLNQLLSADAELLTDLLPRLARRIGSSGQGMDLLPLADLALADSTETLEHARLAIARSFVMAASKDTPEKDKRTAA